MPVCRVMVIIIQAYHAGMEEPSPVREDPKGSPAVLGWILDGDLSAHVVLFDLAVHRVAKWEEQWGRAGL